jgi:hypothetical protein
VSSVVIELERDSDLATDEQLRAALPQLFDPRPFLDHLDAELTPAAARAIEAFKTIEGLEQDARWSNEAIARVRTALDADLELVARLSADSEIVLSARHDAASDEDQLDGARRRTVIVSIADVEPLVASLFGPLMRMERFVMFARDAQEQNAELRRLDGKIRELEEHRDEHRRHEAALIREIEAATGQRTVAEATARRERAPEAGDQAEEKLRQKVQQRERLATRLRDALDSYVRGDAEPVDVERSAALRRGLVDALRFERTDSYVVRTRLADRRERRRRRARSLQRGMAIGIGIALVAIAGFVAVDRLLRSRGEEADANPGQVDAIRSQIVNHRFLRTRLNEDELRAFESAKTRAQLKAAYDKMFERLKASGEPRDDEIPSVAWGTGIEIFEIGHDNVRVGFRSRDTLELLRERFGEDTTLTVKFGSKTVEPKYPMPMTLLRDDLCRGGHRLRFSMRIGLPFDTDITTTGDFPIDAIAQSHCP